MSSQIVRTALFLIVALANSGRGDEESEGIGPPPSFGIISVSDGQGFLEYRFYTTTPVHDGQNGTKQVMTEVAARTGIAEDKERNPTSDVRVLDLNGKRVKKADAVKLLKEGTPVVICADGMPVSKFYRKHLRPDILILSRPAEKTFAPTPR